MNPILIALPLVLTSVMLVILAALAWRRRPAPGALAMTVLLLSVAWWVAAYAFELSSDSLATQVFWAKAEYFGIVIVPLAWFILAWRLAGRPQLRRAVLLTVCFLPVAFLAGVWTNPYHLLHWTNLRQTASGTGQILVVEHGPLFWLHWSYVIVLVVAGVVVLVTPFRRGRALQRRQIGLLWLAASVPFLANILYVSRANPFPLLDLTPFAFAVSAAIGAWAFLRFGLLDIRPFARDLTVASIQDAVVVVNLDEVVVQANPAAETILGTPSSSLVGRRSSEVLPPAIASVVAGRAGSSTYQIVRNEAGPAGWVEVRVSSVTDQRGSAVGNLLLLRDVSEQRQLEIQRQEVENRRVAELAALFATSIAINAHQSLAQLLPAIVERAARLLGVSSGSLYLVRPDGRSLELVIQHNVPQDFVGTVLQFDEGLSGRVASSASAMMVPDHSRWEHKAVAFRDTPFRRVLAVPLLVDSQVIGVLNVMDSEKSGSFGSDEVRLAELFATQAAIAIEKTRLLEAEQGQRRTAEALRDVAMALSPEVDQERVLDLILEQVGRVVPYEAAHIFLVSEDQAYIARTRGIERFDQAAVEALKSVTYRISETPNLARMVETRQPLVLSDVRLEPSWLTIEHLSHVQSWAGAPIVVQNEIIAFCSLDHSQPGFYKSEVVYPLTAFASLAAAALANVRLYGRLHEALAARERLLRSVSHELRTPLAVILGYADLLHDQTARANSPVGQGLGMIVEQATELKHLVDQLIAFQELDLEEMQLTNLAVGPWLEELSLAWTPLLARKGLRLDCALAADSGWMLGDRRFLDQAMSSVIDHASRTGAASSAVAITAARRDNAVVITVSGSGAASRSAAAAGPLAHAGSADAKPATGLPLGLSMAREVVQRHRGTFRADNTASGLGLAIALTFPVCSPPIDYPPPSPRA